MAVQKLWIVYNQLIADDGNGEYPLDDFLHLVVAPKINEAKEEGHRLTLAAIAKRQIRMEPPYDYITHGTAQLVPAKDWREAYKKLTNHGE